jgi:fibronectin type 3 domain-containing protein
VPVLPGAPQSLVAAASDGAVTLSWSAPGDGGSAIKDYNVYRSTTQGAEALIGTSTGNATTYADTGLSDGTTYYYQVSAVNGVGEGPRSTEISAVPAVVGPPSAPQSPSASVSNGAITVSWSPPSSNGGASVTSYNVYRGTSAGNESTTAYTSSTGTSFTDTAVSLGTTYYYVVKAVNTAGSGAASGEVSALAAKAPGAITNLVAKTATTRGITLTWSAPASNGAPIQGYKIYRSRSSGSQSYYLTVTCSTTSCSFTDTATTQSAIYYYRVAAYNSAGTAALSNRSYARAR